MKYKVGDRVRLKKPLINHWRDGLTGSFAGKIVTIDSYTHDGCDYVIVEDDRTHYWPPEQFECLDEEGLEDFLCNLP